MTQSPAGEYHVVVGAGQVGTAVARQLAAAGHRVLVISRSGRPVAPEPADAAATSLITTQALDLGADGAGDRLTALTHGATAIYNCANPPYHRWVTDWPPIAAALLQAAERTGAVLVTCSNLYAYGPVDRPMTEDLPIAPTGAKGRVRAQMWQDALAAHTAGRLRATEVRGSSYLCPGDQSMAGDRLMPRLLAGKAPRLIGDVDQPHSLTAPADTARLMIVAAHDPRAWGRAWHVPSAPARTQRQVVTELATRAGVPVPTIGTTSRAMLRLVGLVVPEVRELGEVMHQFERPWVIDASAAQETFGLTATPWEEQLDALIAHYRRGSALAA